MSLRDYLKHGRRWLWVLILAPVAGGAAAFLITSTIDPTYAATAEIAVNQVQDDAGPTYASVLGNQSLTTTYAHLVTSSKNLERAAASLHGGTFEDRQVSASAVEGTFLIRVRAEDRNPDRAAEIANAVANAFPGFIREVQLAGDDATGRPINTVFISEPAVAVDSPVAPATRTNVIIGVVLGLAVALAAVAFIEYMDDRVRSDEDLERLGSPFLGSVARLDRSGGLLAGGPTRRPGPEEEAFVENLRHVAANLQFALTPGTPHVILVTSAQQGDGKTTVASNLAVALSRLSRNTLVLDGDLRRPAIHRSFRLPNASGLSNAIAGAVEEPKVFQLSDTLSVLTSGPVPPNPSELLASPRLTAIIQDLSQRFEAVIVDCPPMAGIADTALWLSRTGAAVLVLRHGDSHSHAVKRCIIEIESRGVALLGTVLNFTPRESQAAYGYRYGYAQGPRSKPGRITRALGPLAWWNRPGRGDRRHDTEPPGLDHPAPSGIARD
jgi:capsular exopolysaccharide synthesis family protein